LKLPLPLSIFCGKGMIAGVLAPPAKARARSKEATIPPISKRLIIPNGFVLHFLFIAPFCLLAF
jgi:hypothetical protein